MGKRIIVVSSELWTELCTQGHEIGRHGVVTCTAGLPEDAKLVEVIPGQYPGHDEPVLRLVYEHPSWDGSHGGAPTMRIEYSWDSRIEIAGHECGGPGVLDLWCREKDGEFFIEDPEYAPVRVNFCPFCGAKAPKQMEWAMSRRWPEVRWAGSADQDYLRSLQCGIVRPEDRGPLSPNAHCATDVPLNDHILGWNVLPPIGSHDDNPFTPRQPPSTTCFHCGLRYDGDAPQFCSGCGAGL